MVKAMRTIPILTDLLGLACNASGQNLNLVACTQCCFLNLHEEEVHPCTHGKQRVALSLLCILWNYTPPSLFYHHTKSLSPPGAALSLSEGCDEWFPTFLWVVSKDFDTLLHDSFRILVVGPHNHLGCHILHLNIWDCGRLFICFSKIRPLHLKRLFT